MIRFSILIPVYNVASFVEDCLVSILRQDFNSYEVIIVDDGSSDGSGAICDEYAKSDERFTVIHNSNHGLIYTRRCALAKANGEYIIFLDSDDYLEDNALSVIDATIKETGSDCIIYGMQQVLDGSVVYTNTEPSTITICDKEEIFRKYFISDKYNSIWRKAVKHSVFDGRDYSPFYGIQMSEDVLQSVEIIQNSKSITFLSDILYNYRVNSSSITQTVAYEKYKVNFDIREYVLEEIVSSNVLSHRDLLRYYTLCLSRLCDEISTIASFETEMNKKKALYREIKKNNYYKRIITEGHTYSLNIRDAVILLSFRTNMFFVLDLFKRIAKLRKQLRK